MAIIYIAYSYIIDLVIMIIDLVIISD